jgi:hypothetical protein
MHPTPPISHPRALTRRSKSRARAASRRLAGITAPISISEPTHPLCLGFILISAFILDIGGLTFYLTLLYPILPLSIGILSMRTHGSPPTRMIWDITCPTAVPQVVPYR